MSANKITEPGAFLKYFQLFVPTSEISHEKISELFNRWNNYDKNLLRVDISKEIETKSKDKDFIRVLTYIKNYYVNADNLDFFKEKIVPVLLGLTDKLGERIVFTTNLYSITLGIVLDTLDLLSKEKDFVIYDYLSNKLNLIDSNTFLCDLIGYLIYDKSPTYPNIYSYYRNKPEGRERLIFKGVEILDKRFLEDKINIFNSQNEFTGFVLHRWITSWKTASSLDRDKGRDKFKKYFDRILTDNQERKGSILAKFLWENAVTSDVNIISTRKRDIFRDFDNNLKEFDLLYLNSHIASIGSFNNLDQNEIFIIEEFKKHVTSKY